MMFSGSKTVVLTRHGDIRASLMGAEEKRQRMFKRLKMLQKRMCCCISNSALIVVEVLYRKYLVHISQEAFNRVSMIRSIRKI